MRVSATKPKPRLENSGYSLKYKIREYGKGNDYPQKVMDITMSSGTGKVCYDVYRKFIDGGGFVDEALGAYKINPGTNGNNLLRKVAADLRMFGGFALLVKYNALAEPFAAYNVPFEHCRLEVDKDKELTGRIVVYPDWTLRYGKMFEERKVKHINGFDPSAVADQIMEVGGADNYVGQILYATTNGDFEYPLSPVDPVVTDMLTEDSVATVKHRNAKNNFLPSGILIRKGIRPKTLDNGVIDLNDDYNRQLEESAEDIKNLQGDENACKIWVMDVDQDEEKPEFVPFDAKNFDRQFELTEKTVQDNIGRMNMVPPILRGVDVGAGFGAELMSEAYAFMNSVTSSERRLISENLTPITSMFGFPSADIKPLQYLRT